MKSLRITKVRRSGVSFVRLSLEESRNTHKFLSDVDIACDTPPIVSPAKLADRLTLPTPLNVAVAQQAW